MNIQIGLMGGLGNQIFQLATALEISRKLNGKQVFLNPNLGHYRSNAKGVPEITSFIIPEEITVLRKRFYRLWLGKLFGHRRKVMINPMGFEKFAIYRSLLGFLTSIQTFLVLGSRGKVEIIQEIGFQDFPIHNHNAIYVGYFQSFRYSESTQSKLMGITSNEYEVTQKSYRELAAHSSPLVIHVRLGDYLLDNNFGVPNEKYYGNSIEIQMATKLYDSIWLFSDDFDKAIDFIPGHYRSLVKIVSEAQNSSAATLEIMRLGKGYIIGNSTFSWWGAKLSHNADSKVIAPKPWFKGMPEPKEIIPPEWQRISAWAD
jgi:hypothetical protein